MYTGGCDGGYAFKALHFFYLLHLHSPHISMQVMARAENTVFLRVEEKDSNLEIFSVYAFPAKKDSRQCTQGRLTLYRSAVDRLYEGV